MICVHFFLTMCNYLFNDQSNSVETCSTLISNPFPLQLKSLHGSINEDNITTIKDFSWSIRNKN